MFLKWVSWNSIQELMFLLSEVLVAWLHYWHLYHTNRTKPFPEILIDIGVLKTRLVLLIERKASDFKVFRRLVWKHSLNFMWCVHHTHAIEIIVILFKQPKCFYSNCVQLCLPWVLAPLSQFPTTHITCVLSRSLCRLLNKASHLTEFYALYGSLHLPVTPVQLMRPGIGRNASCAVGDFT